MRLTWHSIAEKLAEMRRKEEEDNIKATRERELNRRKEAKNMEEAKRQVGYPDSCLSLFYHCALTRIAVGRE